MGSTTFNGHDARFQIKERSQAEVYMARKHDDDQHLVPVFIRQTPVPCILHHLNNEYAKCHHPLFFGGNKTTEALSQSNIR